MPPKIRDGQFFSMAEKAYQWQPGDIMQRKWPGKKWMNDMTIFDADDADDAENQVILDRDKKPRTVRIVRDGVVVFE
jgi:hypothetical protein